MSFPYIPWPVIKALVAAGHVLPKPIYQFALKHHVGDEPLSTWRWLLQQGMPFDSAVLLSVAGSGRLDVLQLAYSNRVPITADIITEAARQSRWAVLVWACRNGVIFDCAHIQQLLLRQKYLRFSFDEQKSELLELLQDMRKHDGPAADRAQKRRTSKR